MPDFTKPLSFSELGNFDADTLIGKVRMFCVSGKGMHPEALKAVVLKLTYYSRDMGIKQDERDTAATIATSLANAAIKSYGAHSEFSRELMNGIQMITNNHAAA